MELNVSFSLTGLSNNGSSFISSTISLFSKLSIKSCVTLCKLSFNNSVNPENSAILFLISLTLWLVLSISEYSSNPPSMVWPLLS